MGSGKRASMREGPLAALFRKTETEGLESAPAGQRRAAAAARGRDAARVPTPQERLRHAFSSDLPENIMAPPSAPPPASRLRATTRPRPRRSARRSCASSASAARASTRSTG